MTRIVSSLLLVLSVGSAAAWAQDDPSAALHRELITVANRNEVRGSVNGEPITQYEIDRDTAPIFRELEKKYEGLELRQQKLKAEQEVLQDRVERLLILQAARRGLSDEQRERIDFTVDRFIKERIRELGSLIRLNRELKKQGLDVQQLRELETENRIIREFQADLIARRINVSPADIRTYYQTHLEEFTTGQQLDVRLILLSNVAYRDPVKALAKAKDLRAKATGDKPWDFGKLAAEHSNYPDAAKTGGLLENLKLPHFEEEVDKAIEKLDQGEISQPIQTVVGTYLIKVETRRPPRTAPLDEVQDDIRAKLIRQQSMELRQRFVAELFKAAVLEPETLLQ